MFSQATYVIRYASKATDVASSDPNGVLSGDRSTTTAIDRFELANKTVTVVSSAARYSRVNILPHFVGSIFALLIMIGSPF